MKVGDLVRSWVAHNDGVGIIIGFVRTYPREVVIRWFGKGHPSQHYIPREDFEDDLRLGNMEIINEAR